MKDLNRETVIIGERSFQATLGDSDTFGFSSKIMFLLMESIRRVDKSLQSTSLSRIQQESEFYIIYINLQVLNYFYRYKRQHLHQHI